MRSLYAAKYADSFYLHDTLSIIGNIFWAWTEADRFGILNKNCPYNYVVDPSIKLPNLHPEKSPEMRDLILNRATNIINKARENNKKIAILWSGGVDSTSIISAFLLAGATKDELIILCTQESIDEYEYGYNKMKNEFGLEIVIYKWVDSINQYTSLGHDVYFITGWCADQLFGSNVNLYFPDYYDKEWKDSLLKIIKVCTYDRLNCTTVKPKEIENAIEEFSNYADKLDINLKYNCDALWLFNFGIKWSHVSRDFLLTLTDPEQRKNVINFYEDVSFQEWSLTHYEDFYKYNQTLDVKYYKRPLKELSYEVFKDKDYLNKKGKVNSWKSAMDGEQYSKMEIWDTETGITMYDLNVKPNYPTEENDPKFLCQLRNRRYYMLPYLKANVDKTRYLSGEFW